MSQLVYKRGIRNEKQEITALVIRYRLYLANEYAHCKKEYERYDFAGSVLNLSCSSVRTILHKNPRIRALSKIDCMKELRYRSPLMFAVAECDITLNKYLDLIHNDSI